MYDIKPATSGIFIIIVTTIASFMTAFMGSAINVALPIIGKEFKADAVLLSWLSTSYLVTTAVLLIPIGKLSDIYGRARFFKAGIVIFAFFSAKRIIQFRCNASYFQGNSGCRLIYDLFDINSYSCFSIRFKGKRESNWN